METAGKGRVEYHVQCVQSFHVSHHYGEPQKCTHPWDCGRLHDTRIAWEESFHNLFVLAGRNKVLDAALKTGLTTPLWYIGLKGTGSVVDGDTMESHGGWSDIVPYSNATRPAFTPGTIAAGSVDNSAAKAVFNINATATVAGAFMTDSATKSGTTGVLYGAGDIATPRAVASGDTLNVQATASLAAG